VNDHPALSITENMSDIFLSIVLHFVYTRFCLFTGGEPAPGGWFSLSEYLSIAHFHTEVGIKSPLTSEAVLLVSCDDAQVHKQVQVLFSLEL
jgi:hypothetical protein